MNEKPILFSGPMVRAILDGRKTQTRRVVKLPLIDRNYMGNEVAGCEVNSMLRQGHYELCPYGQPGDRLWVRETWGPCEGGVCYRASEGPTVKPDGGKWKPSIFMPRWASRITLDLTAVRVERVQDISETDCYAEGIDRPHPANLGSDTTRRDNARNSYRALWDSINAKRGFGWDINPWVWVLEFKKL